MAQEHYFSSSPETEFNPKPLEVELAGRQVRVVTASGIFSPAGIDKGTAILLDEAPAPVGPRVLDIGTGWGPITLTLAMELPDAQVFGVEVNERSAQLTRMNAEALKLTNVEVSSPDELDPSLTFNTIWSNPPIRVGKEVLHGILRQWMPRLAPGGCAYLVVQKNLGADSLQKWLSNELETHYPGDFQVSRYSTSKGFRLLQVARKPV